MLHGHVLLPDDKPLPNLCWILNILQAFRDNIVVPNAGLAIHQHL